MKILLIVNPYAGGGRARRVGEFTSRILHNRHLPFDLVYSESAEDLTRQSARAVKEGHDLVLVVGGDGSWNLALNGIAHSGVPAGLISCGRGNDFRRNLGLPRDPISALDIALEGRIRALDLVHTGHRYYIGVAGVGFDSEVTECANNRIPLLAGALAYSAAVFYKLLSFKPKKLRIEHDGGVFDGDVMFAVFGNSKSYGGGMKITPQAEMDDGLIDVVIVRRISIPNLLYWMPSVFSGRHLIHPKIDFFRTTKAYITSPEPMDLYGDGDFIAPLPLTLQLHPKAVLVKAP